VCFRSGRGVWWFGHATRSSSCSWIFDRFKRLQAHKRGWPDSADGGDTGTRWRGVILHGCRLTGRNVSGFRRILEMRYSRLLSMMHSHVGRRVPGLLWLLADRASFGFCEVSTVCVRVVYAPPHHAAGLLGGVPSELPQYNAYFQIPLASLTNLSIRSNRIQAPASRWRVGGRLKSRSERVVTAPLNRRYSLRDRMVLPHMRDSVRAELLRTPCASRNQPASRIRTRFKPFYPISSPTSARSNGHCRLFLC